METVYSDIAFIAFQSSSKRYITATKASSDTYGHSSLGLSGQNEMAQDSCSLCLSFQYFTHPSFHVMNASFS